MAIIVEEQPKGDNTLTVLTIGAVVLGIVVAAYLVFFSPAPLVEKALPPSISNIGSVNLQITPLTNSSVYNLITATSGIGAPSATTTGREDPFLPF
ncbi:MAG: hypothetical protein M1153_00570 [Patescibacteria group bacterium]|nr:hypothetical protein [Patescibacteria group bacterium]